MKKTWPLATALALALVATTATVGRAEMGPGTDWVNCRNTAYSNYYGCLSRSSSFYGEAGCYWGEQADLGACDKSLWQAMT